MTMQEQSAFDNIDEVKKALLENGLNLAHDVLHQAENVLKKSIEERKTGRWIYLLDGSGNVECTKCGVEQPVDSYYCPFCGAKMEMRYLK